MLCQCSNGVKFVKTLREALQLQGSGFNGFIFVIETKSLVRVIDGELPDEFIQFAQQMLRQFTNVPSTVSTQCFNVVYNCTSDTPNCVRDTSGSVYAWQLKGSGTYEIEVPSQGLILSWLSNDSTRKLPELILTPGNTPQVNPDNSAVTIQRSKLQVHSPDIPYDLLNAIIEAANDLSQDCCGMRTCYNPKLIVVSDLTLPSNPFKIYLDLTSVYLEDGTPVAFMPDPAMYVSNDEWYILAQSDSNFDLKFHPLVTTRQILAM